jgi:ABC-2 type transport system permease protein
MESDSASYDLYIQDLDDSQHSEQLISIFENITILNVKILDENKNVKSSMKESSVSTAIVIPYDFSENIQQSYLDDDITGNITFYFDPTQQTTTSILQSIIGNVVQDYNLGLSGGKHVILIKEEKIIGENLEFIDFFIPGMIGFTVMTSCIYGSIERNTKFRKDGILRKMLTMPITRTDWIFAKMLFMLLLSFISTTVILLFGVLVWELSVNITIFAIILIIATSFMFSGMGMIISRFVRDEETADMAGGAITFPMMFLAGTFFSLDQMPIFLKTIAQFLPLYYVNEGLRNAMIFMDIDKSLWYTGLVLIFACFFFISGSLLSKWEED